MPNATIVGLFPGSMDRASSTTSFDPLFCSYLPCRTSFQSELEIEFVIDRSVPDIY
jgi:hypothetical protein